MSMNPVGFLWTMSTLLSLAIATGTRASPLAPQVGATYEITLVRDSAQKGSNGSSGSSHDQDTIIERVARLRADGEELQYDLPNAATADERARNWQYPARVFKPAAGPPQLINGPVLEARVDGWLKASGLSRSARGHWIFTWTAVRIECDPQSGSFWGYPMKSPMIPPPVWMLILGAMMWVLGRTYPLGMLIPAPWNQLGWLVMAIAPIAPTAAIVQFWRAHTTANPHKPEAATTLVTAGIYAWTRNPMYLGLSILLLGWAMTLGTLSSVWGPVLFLILIQRFQILPEEYALRKRFGHAYEEYCRTVHRWIGRTGRL